jgi:hypothetical protein
LYECETWSLTLKEEHIGGHFENRVLRRIFGPRSNEVMGGWRKVHSEELHNVYSSPSVKNDEVKEDEVGRAMLNACKILVGKPEGKSSLGRHRYRWEDNIKMVKIQSEDWTGLIWFRMGPSERLL